MRPSPLTADLALRILLHLRLFEWFNFRHRRKQARRRCDPDAVPAAPCTQSAEHLCVNELRHRLVEVLAPVSMSVRNCCSVVSAACPTHSGRGLHGQCIRFAAMRALCRYTRKRFGPAHGDVLHQHTGGLSLSSPSLFLSLPSFSFSALLSSLCSLLSSLSETMTMITRPVGTHGSNLPECQSAWASDHSLFGDFVRIVQETSVLA